MNASNPIARSIPEYLDQLRAALAGADPALIQDALYDAEDYLRSEWAEHPELDEAGLLASIAGSYGAPSEVADIYRETEVTVNQALRVPAARPRVTAQSTASLAAGSAGQVHSATGPGQAAKTVAAAPQSLFSSFFGVLADPRAYTSLLYMLLSLATGIFYFTWAVTGLSMSAGFAVLIIGIPFTIIFFASVRLLSLVEGRLVEAMLGERMPRRPPYADPNQGLLSRIKELFLDIRTWSTFVYMLLMLPLGLCYFTFAVLALSLSLAVAILPFASLYFDHFHLFWFDGAVVVPMWLLPLTLATGLLMLVLTLHLARGLGMLHGTMAKHFLVKLAPA